MVPFSAGILNSLRLLTFLNVKFFCIVFNSVQYSQGNRMNAYLILFAVVVFLASHASGQTKEELYNVQLLGMGQPDQPTQPDVVARYWTNFALTQIKYLRSDPANQQLVEELTVQLKPLLGPPVPEMTLGFIEPLGGLQGDEQIANKVFDLLGPEYCARMIHYDVCRRLEDQKNRQLTKWNAFSSELLFEGLARNLNLSGGQKNRIREELELAEREFHHEGLELMDEISSASNHRWRNLLRALNPEQRKLAESRIGAPFEWHRDLQNQQARSKLGQLPAIVGFCGYGKSAFQALHAMNIPIGDGAALRAISDEQLKEHRIVIYDILVYNMLFHVAIGNALELVPDQKKRIASLKNPNESELPDECVLTDVPDRFDNLMAGVATLPEPITDVLLPDQIQSFLQIELQLRLDEKFDSTVGLLDPRIISHWKIDQRQAKILKQIGDQFESERKSLTDQLAERRSKIQFAIEQKFSDILNDEQKKTLKAFTGKDLATTAK